MATKTTRGRTPAKRTTKKTVRRTTSKKQNSTDWKWRVISILMIIALLLFVIKYVFPNSGINSIVKDATEIANSATTSTTEGDNRTFIPPTYNSLEIPEYTPTTESQIIYHAGYSVSYNFAKKNPNWVAYEVTKGELKGNEKRADKFIADPKLQGKSAINSNYTKSGYDRGHMAPAADMKWGEEIMEESFYFTNISPQTPSLNRGAWRILEEDIRTWTHRDSALVVICGPIYGRRTKELKGGVKIPKAFYKVVAAPYIENPRAIAFIMPNDKKVDNDITKYIVSVDEVEKLLNMDVLSKLPDSIETQIERTSNYTQWR